MLQQLKSSYSHIFEDALLEEISILINGAIKILKEDKDGSELLLYFIEKGETCAMTMNCCLGMKKSEIRAITEMDTQIVMIPVQKMEEWTGKYKNWRHFVFDSYHNRLTEMLATIESVAFGNMDQRLINYLKEKSRINNTATIHNTHQEIAYDLHSSRVVISYTIAFLFSMVAFILFYKQLSSFTKISTQSIDFNEHVFLISETITDLYEIESLGKNLIKNNDSITFKEYKLKTEKINASIDQLVLNYPDTTQHLKINSIIPNFITLVL